EAELVMRLGSTKNILYMLVLLGIGLAVGWWLRGDLDTQPQDYPPATNTPPPRLPAPDPDAVEWQAVFQNPPAPGPQASDPESAPPPQNDNRGLKEQFVALSAAGSFTAAMDIYREVEYRTGGHKPEFKRLVLEHLEQYLSAHDASSLTSLVDAFL